MFSATFGNIETMQNVYKKGRLIYSFFINQHHLLTMPKTKSKRYGII